MTYTQIRNKFFKKHRTVILEHRGQNMNTEIAKFSDGVIAWVCFAPISALSWLHEQYFQV